ncbi:ferritin family protein [Sporolactobacillus terrae]|uniref:Rubrerythrin diiron-binding domain-containing protein n=1 Tax=Sporolactobacillus terrae TaxID=269673 RepID=A0A5K7WYR3_9BACL|nr:ferritin-like domain-containing protein [Sporolactobacillus terrae]BBN97758.1 hypothetical protein St703_04630 [Sporolactobacillus terrae]
MPFDDAHDRQPLEQNSGAPFVDAILNAIKGEAAAVDFYGRLAEAAPNAAMRDRILSIRRDEQDHFHLFSRLYEPFTEVQASVPITAVAFGSFSNGLRIAYRDELNDYETYRNLYLNTQALTTRNILLRAFTDEIKHAVRFGFMTVSLV